MKNSFKGCYRLIFSLIAVVSVPQTYAQQNPPIEQETVLSFVHDLLQVFYPDLICKGHRLKLCVLHPAEVSWREISGVFFTVLPDLPPGNEVAGVCGPDGCPKPKPKPDPDAILLDGSVWIPPVKGCRIEEITVHTLLSAKSEAFLKTAKVQPEWSYNEAVAALKEAGARFGPNDKQALLDSVPWDQLQRFLGKLTVTRVWFSWQDEEQLNMLEMQHVRWIVGTKADFDDGTNATYNFSFEPFEGRLISASRRPD